VWDDLSLPAPEKSGDLTLPQTPTFAAEVAELAIFLCENRKLFVTHNDEIQHRWFSEGDIAERVDRFLARRRDNLTPAEHDMGAAYGPSFPPRFVDRNSIWQPAQVPEARDHHAFVDHGN
jgi:hypothetical protein